MTVSVIIPAYNAAATIGNALQALAHQDHPALEVIVVDDGSTDNTAAVVQGFAFARYVRQDNAGPAAARNYGASLARAEFLCFTDSDCVPHQDWILLLLAGFRSPDIAVVCGSYGIANPQSMLARGIHAEILYRHEKLMPDFPKAFGSYNFCVKKEVFTRVGGFSPGYRRASGEDNDLSYRVLKTGHKIYFERKALVDHHHTVALGRYLKEQFRHGFWRAKMYAEHPTMAAGDDYTFWKDVLEVPWAAGCALSGALSLVLGGGIETPLYGLFLPFLFFEIFFAQRMLRDAHAKIFELFFFGFVMFARAFARAFGLSTGILYFLFKKPEKKSK